MCFNDVWNNCVGSMKIISNNKSLKDFHSLFERNEFKEDDETY